MSFRFTLQSVALSAALITASTAFGQEKVTFGTNWFAQPGHGGFYQAVVDGTYKRFGLDVGQQPPALAHRQARFFDDW
jgi:NitT/TauT family transport system substrate-binding protein